MSFTAASPTAWPRAVYAADIASIVLEFLVMLASVVGIFSSLFRRHEFFSIFWMLKMGQCVLAILWACGLLFGERWFLLTSQIFASTTSMDCATPLILTFAIAQPLLLCSLLFTFRLRLDQIILPRGSGGGGDQLPTTQQAHHSDLQPHHLKTEASSFELMVTSPGFSSTHHQHQQRQPPSCSAFYSDNEKTIYQEGQAMTAATTRTKSPLDAVDHTSSANILTHRGIQSDHHPVSKRPPAGEVATIRSNSSSRVSPYASLTSMQTRRRVARYLTAKSVVYALLLALLQLVCLLMANWISDKGAPVYTITTTTTTTTTATLNGTNPTVYFRNESSSSSDDPTGGLTPLAPPVVNTSTTADATLDVVTRTVAQRNVSSSLPPCYQSWLQVMFQVCDNDLVNIPPNFTLTIDGIMSSLTTPAAASTSAPLLNDSTLTSSSSSSSSTTSSSTSGGGATIVIVTLCHYPLISVLGTALAEVLFVAGLNATSSSMRKRLLNRRVRLQFWRFQVVVTLLLASAAALRLASFAADYGERKWALKHLHSMSNVTYTTHNTTMTTTNSNVTTITTSSTQVVTSGSLGRNESTGFSGGGGFNSTVSTEWSNEATETPLLQQTPHQYTPDVTLMVANVLECGFLLLVVTTILR